MKDRIAVRMIDAAEAVGRAAAGRDDRRADVRQHRRRPRDRRPAARLSLHLRLPGQGERATRSTRCGPTAPRWSCAPLRSRPRIRAPTTRCPTGWPARSRARGSRTSTRTRTTRCRHYETTGPEIWEQTEGRVTHFVAGVGTGGTISGVGRYLKEASGGRVQVIGADPEGSVYSGGTGRPVPRRRRRRGLLAGDVRPNGRATRSSRYPTPTRSR